MQPKKNTIVKKKKTLEDVYFPVPMDFNPVRSKKAPCNQSVVRKIAQSSIQVAYGLKTPDPWDYHGNYVRPKPVVTHDQVEMIMHLIESLHPTDAIEAALASQFAITYVRAMESKDYGGNPSVNLELFEFGHKVLDALQKYRNKGAQQISVQYNVNRGQVVNIKNVKPNTSLEGEVCE